jgi:uncharacterized protein (DUF1684 family)
LNKLIIIASILYAIPTNAQHTESLLKELLNHRSEKDAEFKDTSSTILPKDMALKFKGLNYFDPNPAFRVTAIFKKKIGKEFHMTTSSGKKKKFRQYGILTFKLNGKKLTLPIYQNIKLMQTEAYQNYIFIPFTDLTNGNETYGGGRYIETTIPTGDTLTLDFNYSFNPYCHYTTGYNCPIPPKENFLDIRIEAGEKIYQ